MARDGGWKRIRDLMEARWMMVEGDWVCECVSFLKSTQASKEGPVWSEKGLFQAVCEQYLYSDLREMGLPVLPNALPAGLKQPLRKVCILQVLNSVNIALPLADQEKESPRMVKFLLSDVSSQLVAIEYKPIPTLPFPCPIGCKLLIRNAMVCDSILFLTPENTQVLGGGFIEDSKENHSSGNNHDEMENQSSAAQPSFPAEETHDEPDQAIAMDSSASYPNPSHPTEEKKTDESSFTQFRASRFPITPIVEMTEAIATRMDDALPDTSAGGGGGVRDHATPDVKSTSLMSLEKPDVSLEGKETSHLQTEKKKYWTLSEFSSQNPPSNKVVCIKAMVEKLLPPVFTDNTVQFRCKIVAEEDATTAQLDAKLAEKLLGTKLSVFVNNITSVEGKIANKRLLARLSNRLCQDHEGKVFVKYDDQHVIPIVVQVLNTHEPSPIIILD